MLEATISISIGYLLGSLSPAAFIAAIKNKNLRESGTKNLGATNVTLALGKTYGVLVMIIDILKAFLSVKIAKFLFPQFVLSGLLAGCFSVIGHIFPIYMNFKGGKGLAAFGGMVLALDFKLFLILLTLGIVFILLTNYAVSLTFSATTLAPFLFGFKTRNFLIFLLMGFVSCLIIYKHHENISRIRNGSEMKVNEFFKR